MEHLLVKLARQMGRDPLVADAQGCYHLWVDGYSLFLERQGWQLVVRSSLGQAAAGALGDKSALQRLLERVTQWARHCPQALALNAAGEFVLEARVELDGLPQDEFQRVLETQVSILESLEPTVLRVQTSAQWSPSVWRP